MEKKFIKLSNYLHIRYDNLEESSILQISSTLKNPTSNYLKNNISLVDVEKKWKRFTSTLFYVPAFEDFGIMFSNLGKVLPMK